MTKPTVLVAAAALIDVDGRVLICQRPQGKRWPACGSFPAARSSPARRPNSA
jgi:8-oxo-dGTP diphosphatase